MRIKMTQTQLAIYLAGNDPSDGRMYILPVLYDLGQLAEEDLGRFARAVERTIMAHPSLFMHITPGEDGIPCFEPDEDTKVQVTIEEASSREEVIDRISETGADGHNHIKPIDFTGRLWVCRIFKTPEGSFFFFCAHHILLDGRSFQIFTEQLQKSFETGEAPATEEYTLADLCRREDELRSSSSFDEELNWYMQNFAVDEFSGFPGSPRKEAKFGDFRKESCPLEISPQKIEEACTRYGIGKSALFNGAFAYLLAACNYSEEASYGTAFHGRTDPRFTDTMAMVVRTMPVYVKVGKDETVREYLSSIQAQEEEVRRRDLVSTIDLNKKLGWKFNVLFTYEGSLSHFPLNIGGRSATFSDLRPLEADIDFAVDIVKKEDGFVIEVEYPHNVLSSEAVHDLTEYYTNILSGLIEKEYVRDVEFLTDEQKAEVIKSSRGRHLDLDITRTTAGLISEKAKTTPDALAVDDDTEKLTYAQLEHRANIVAWKLIGEKVQPDDFVGILLDRGASFPVCALAIHKAGAAYLPLDPEYPVERLQYMVENSRLSVLITTREILRSVQEEGSFKVGKCLFLEEIDFNASAEVVDLSKPEGNAYIIYTSGSTGLPKGVVLHHAGLMNLCAGLIEALELKPSDRIASHSSFSFDAHVDEVYPVLTAGGSLHIMPSGIRKDMDGIVDFLRRHQIHGADFTTSLGMLLARRKDLNMRFMTFGGEKLSGVVSDKILFFNEYGPTECTDIACMYRLERGSRYDDIPIGEPMPNLWCFVLDRFGHLLPPGIPGELCVAGIQVGRGYWRLPDKTGEVFSDCPFVEQDDWGREVRMYHTGDLALYGDDGQLYCIGRIDSQIKLNGFRVELGEIENRAMDIPGIKDAAANVLKAGGGAHLVLYYVTEADSSIDNEKVKEALGKTSLAAYMIPEFYMKLDELPRTPSGKVDRRNLPVPEFRADTDIVFPTTEKEKILWDITKGILGTDRFGVNTDLLRSGLSSLDFLILVTAAEEHGVKISVSDITKYRNIKEILLHSQQDTEIISDRKSGDTAQEPAATPEHPDAEAADYTLREEYPLSMNQTGIYIESMRLTGTTAYNIPILFRLGDGVDLKRLEKALEQVILAHPFLSMTIRQDENGEIRAVRHTPAHVDIPVKDVLPSTDQLIRPFEPDSGEPLYRVGLYDTENGKYLFIDTHHIVSDGSSTDILFEELETVYMGGTVEPETYTGFDAALDEERLRKSGSYDKAKEWFDTLLSDVEIDMLPDGDGGNRENTPGHIVYSTASDDGAVSSFCTLEGISENAFFNAVFSFVLSCYTGKQEAFYATIYNGRKDTRLLRTVSMLVKTFPVRISTTKDRKVADYVSAMAEQLMMSMSNDICSFAELAQTYGIDSDVLFAYQGSNRNYTIGGEPAESVALTLNASKAPMLFQVYKEEDHYTYDCEYQSDLFSEEFMHAFASAVETAAKGFLTAKTLGEVNLVTPDVREQLDRFNLTGSPCPFTDMVSVFRSAVEKYPDNLSIIFQDETYTYRQEDDISERIAGYLRAKGIGRGDVVSVLIHRSAMMRFASLGILKTGAAYQPLDPGYPAERLTFMMQDAGCSLLIADGDLLEKVPEYKGPVLLTGDIRELPYSEKAADHPAPEDLFILLYTSGSTGVPKGVMLEHGSIANFCNWYRDYYNLEESSRVAAYASYGFDANMMDMYTAMTAGACVCIMEEELRLDLNAMDVWFNRMGITHSFMTTQVGRQFYLMTTAKSLRYLSVGGEKLVPVQPRDDGPELFNVYGPTECTIFTTTASYQMRGGRVPIGKPLYNYRCYVVDENLNLLPPFMPGELLIAGRGVGRGYLNRPDLTEKTFIPNPFGDDPEYARIYRTGDVVRMLSDGMIDFIGRNDSQVKVRGFRIELTEIEAVIREYPCISDATVQAFENKDTGEKYIAAYVVSDSEVDINALNEFIAARKPAYMVPAVTMQIPAIPLNQNQKVNRRALPAAEPKILTETVPPQTETEEKVLQIAAEVLERDGFGVTTDLTELGLSSISVMRLAALINNRFDRQIRFGDIMGASTVRSLAALLDSQNSGSKVWERRKYYPLSRTQMGIFVDSLNFKDTTVYNIPCLYRLDGQVDMIRLESALERMLCAHPYLSMTVCLGENGEAMASRSEENIVNIEHYDHLPPMDVLVRPFDLTAGEELCRVALIDSTDGKYLFLDTHHIVSDGESLRILLEDLETAYEGGNIETEKYSGFEFALDEQEARASVRFEEARDWYKSACKGAGSQTLPLPEPNLTSDEHIAVGRFHGETDAGAVLAFCEKNGLTPNAFFTTAFGLALKAYTRSETAVFTTIYNGRSDSRLERSVSMFVKTLPVVLNAEPDKSIKEMIEATGSWLLNAMTYDIFSFAEIHETLGINSDVMFAYQGEAENDVIIGGHSADVIETDLSQSKSLLDIDVWLDGGSVLYLAEYDPTHYGTYTIEGFVRMFDTICEELMIREKAGDINLIRKADEQALIKLYDTDSPVKERPAYRLLQDTAARVPEKTALIAVDRTMSYKELNGDANALGHALAEMGAGPETIVAVMADRNSWAYVMRQGVLKSGGAFMPIDPEYPVERISFILENSGAKLLVTTEDIENRRSDLKETLTSLSVKSVIVDRIISGYSRENLNIEVPFEALAYVIYTSGSTGTPKGVMLTNKNLVYYADDNPKNHETLAYTEHGSVSIAMAAFTFDVSLTEEFIPFAHGLTNVLATKEQIMNAVAMRDLMLITHVDCIDGTPSYYLNMMEFEVFHPAIRRLKMLDAGAEAFPAALYEKLRAINPDLYIVNTYGPTECTISCTLKEVTSSKNITIGKPLSNMHMVTIDREGHLQPPGAMGEMVIMGDGVGRGYIGRDDLNKKSFIRMLGKRAYRSGDLVRILANGEIEFHGRIDNQIKLHGFRIELGEIENVINSYPGVRTSVAVVNMEEEYIAAYFTADKAVDQERLKAHMASRLTSYMIPSSLMQLDEMPLTANGKIDKKALPEPVMKERNIEKPENELQQTLCDMFKKALGLEEVGINENFFELGGNSLKAASVLMAAMVRKLPVVYQDIFDAPTVRDLETLILKKDGKEPEQPEQHEQPELSGQEAVSVSETGVLSHNRNEYVDEIEQGSLGDVLLTGTTGFLGSHVLQELIDHTDAKVYCLVRSGKLTAKQRLSSILYYYFDRSFEDEYDRRIFIIEGDIDDTECLDRTLDLNYSTVINCAACVKHFADMEFLKRINLHGVENLTQLCLKKGVRLIQISTVSVGGFAVGESAGGKVFSEDCLDIGQDVKYNAYVYTKYLAEKHVLKAIEEDGLDAKIIRVGSLSGRVRDGEFQVNFRTNAFMNSLRAYAVLGAYPCNALSETVEFSFVDETARAVVLLSGTGRDFTVFHAYNAHTVEMGDIIQTLNDCGIAVENVTSEEFDRRLREGLTREDINSYLSTLVGYDLDDDADREEIPSNNRFTVNALYRLGMRWTISDLSVIKRMIRSLKTLGFFDFA